MATIAARPSLRERFADHVEFHPLAIVESRDSQLDGATKLVLKTHAGYAVETEQTPL